MGLKITKNNKFLKMCTDRFKNDLLLGPSIKLKKCFVKPVHVYWTMATTCNFRCTICPVYQKEVAQEDLVTLPQIKKVIDELSEWGVTQFGISGGEPLLDAPKLTAVLEYANNKGLFTHFVTNGYLLTEDIIRQYSKIGGGYITLSIDGLEHIHDIIRRKEGSFSRCIFALELMKKLQPKNLKMKITTVLNNDNLDDITAVVSLADRYAVPIFIQPYSTSLDRRYLTDSSADIHKLDSLWVSQENMKRLEGVIQQLCEVKKHKPHLIINSLEHLRTFPAYFSNAAAAYGGHCLLGYTNISIMPNGDIIFCGLIGPVGNVGNIKNQSIKSIWYSGESEKARQKMLACAGLCILGCQLRFRLLDLVRFGVRWLLK